MGQTPKFRLPFPDLDDAPNVPADIEALAVAAEVALQSTRLPTPQKAGVATFKPTTGSGAYQNVTGASLTLTNPHSTMNLLVHVVFEGLGLIYGNAQDANLQMVSTVAVTGANVTTEINSRGLVQSADVFGTPKNVQGYGQLFAFAYCTLAPGATLTAKGQVAVTSAALAASKPEFREGGIGIMPVGWVLAAGTPWVDPDHTEPTE